MLKAYVMLNLYAQELVERMEREEGQDLIEYALLAALISVVLVVALQAVATEISTVFSKVVSALSAT